MSKGNTTERRGHRPRLGGEKSKGTARLCIKVPLEAVKRIERKIGKDGSLSDYVRGLIEKDLTSQAARNN
jgi:hypothetical protein